LERCRAALDAGADPAVVAKWIADTQAQRDQALAAAMRSATTAAQPGPQLTADEITTILGDLGDLVSALREATLEHKLDLYRPLGLRLTYHPETRTVHATQPPRVR
jgi:hypothetical protein